MPATLGIGRRFQLGPIPTQPIENLEILLDLHVCEVRGPQRYDRIPQVLLDVYLVNTGHTSVVDSVIKVKGKWFRCLLYRITSATISGCSNSVDNLKVAL